MIPLELIAQRLGKPQGPSATQTWAGEMPNVNPRAPQINMQRAAQLMLRQTPGPQENPALGARGNYPGAGQAQRNAAEEFRRRMLGGR